MREELGHNPATAGSENLLKNTMFLLRARQTNFCESKILPRRYVAPRRDENARHAGQAIASLRAIAAKASTMPGSDRRQFHATGRLEDFPSTNVREKLGHNSKGRGSENFATKMNCLIQHATEPLAMRFSVYQSGKAP